MVGTLPGVKGVRGVRGVNGVDTTVTRCRGVMGAFLDRASRCRGVWGVGGVANCEALGMSRFSVGRHFVEIFVSSLTVDLVVLKQLLILVGDNATRPLVMVCLIERLL